MSNLGASLLIGLACAGCATTSGNAWLSSPLEQQAELNREVSSAAEPSAEARPRLSHTVTLGETYVSPPTPAASSDAPAVQVNVQTQVPIVVNNYGGYGYGYGYGGYGGYGANATTRTTSPRTGSGAPTKVGGDFPAPPDYGPRALR